MEPKESNETIQQPSAVTPGAGLEAEEYVARELVRTRKALKWTQAASVGACLVVVLSMGTITMGFARSMEPQEAATIAKGLVDQHVGDKLPEVKQYIKERVPRLIAQVPSYVKQQMPSYRQNLEAQLETQFDRYADQSSQELQRQFDAFLDSDKDEVQALLTNSQDPKALQNMDANLKVMFTKYLNNTEIGGETLQTKIDMSLDGLTDVDSKMKRLASNQGLTDQEKKARRAIAILLKTVDTNPDLQKANTAVASLQQNAPAQIQDAANGLLQWNAAGEATFTQPGKAPITLMRKPTAETGGRAMTMGKPNPAQPNAVKPNLVKPNQVLPSQTKPQPVQKK
jgi:hypothetical protein